MSSFVKSALLLLLAAAVACSPARHDQQQRLYIFGTLLDIELLDVDRAQAQQAFRELDHQFQRMHRDQSAFVGISVAGGRKLIRSAGGYLCAACRR
jgi:hypothetical protein